MADISICGCLPLHSDFTRLPKIFNLYSVCISHLPVELNAAPGIWKVSIELGKLIGSISSLRWIPNRNFYRRRSLFWLRIKQTRKGRRLSQLITPWLGLSRTFSHLLWSLVEISGLIWIELKHPVLDGQSCVLEYRGNMAKMAQRPNSLINK